MTTRETAAAMRRFADVLEKLPTGPFLKYKPEMSEEAQIGGLVTLQYLIEMVTAGNRDMYDRPTLLVLLDSCAKDREMFQQGLYSQVKSAFMEDDGIEDCL